MNNKLYRILFFAAVLFFGISACRPEQEVADIIDPSTKAVATITASRDLSGSISEGDTIMFTVEMSKAVAIDPIEFSVELEGNSEASEDDITVASAVIQPFEKTGSMMMIVTADNYPELSENLTFKVGAFDLEENWQLSPASDVLEGSLTVNNTNAEGVLTIAMAWTDPADDYDMFVYLGTSLAALGATGNMPEIDATNFSLAVYPDGDYSFAVDPYALDNDATEYSIRFGYGENVEIFDGSFDIGNADDYDTVGGNLVWLTFTKSGSSFTFSPVN